MSVVATTSNKICIRCKITSFSSQRNVCKMPCPTTYDSVLMTVFYTKWFIWTEDLTRTEDLTY